MQNFQELDNMLKKSFDNFNTNAGNKEFNPHYLSTEDILRELTEPDKKIINLEALNKLKEKLHLSDLEIKIILILFAPEVNAKYERVYAYLQDNLNRTYPTVQLLISLLCETSLETQELFNYFITPSKLTMLHLIKFVPNDTNELLFQQPLRLSSSVRNYLLGDIHVEGTLEPYCHIIEPQNIHNKNLKIEQYIESGIKNSEHYLINIYGTSKKRKREEALKIASYFGFGLLCVDTSEAIKEEPLIHKLIPLLARDALLSGTILYFDSFDFFLRSKEKQEEKLFTQLEQLAWLTLFSTKTIWNPREIPKKQNFHTFKESQTKHFKLQEYWQNTISQFDTKLALDIAPLLSNTFHFAEDEIDNISQLIQAEIRLGQAVNKKLILELCRTRISNDLSQYAQHITSSNTIEDIIIPTKQKEQLQEIMVHYKYQNRVFNDWGYEKFFQSKGINLLFSGSSGTGKTMAASILANTLGLELYKIELSQMVSKYIGETEKNLSALFDTAQESGVILFFDEADALFGKRTEVNDSHDRYANIEVSYLLQRIEDYDGIVILASNFKENIDEAFLRRLRFVIDFPVPDAIQRKLIWHKLLPLKLLNESINFAPLARQFKLSGANIRNVALYSAFNAAGEDKKIGIPHIIKALRSELDKIGDISNESDFEDFINN